MMCTVQESNLQPSD